MEPPPIDTTYTESAAFARRIFKSPRSNTQMRLIAIVPVIIVIVIYGGARTGPLLILALNA